MSLLTDRNDCNTCPNIAHDIEIIVVFTGWGWWVWSYLDAHMRMWFNLGLLNLDFIGFWSHYINPWYLVVV